MRPTQVLCDEITPHDHCISDSKCFEYVRNDTPCGGGRRACSYCKRSRCLLRPNDLHRLQIGSPCTGWHRPGLLEADHCSSLRPSRSGWTGNRGPAPPTCFPALRCGCKGRETVFDPEPAAFETWACAVDWCKWFAVTKTQRFIDFPHVLGVLLLDFGRSTPRGSSGVSR